MAVERTLSIVKPDAVARNLIGEIYSRFEKGGLRIVASKMLRLSEQQAGGFYAEHEGKPFYDDLCGYLRSGPVMVLIRRSCTRRRRGWSTLVTRGGWRSGRRCGCRCRVWVVCLVWGCRVWR